ncbi:HTH tetR-type domain-containing protein [Bordetella tumbae]|uniref:TetR/AcrR family transcriptional regulator n=1 Tax=Bordetella tumbae TaxID=1649139 RepID=UPI0039EE90E2
MTAIRQASDTSARSRGRPREFDMDQALDRAVRVFSKRGYHGASISDLTTEMGLTQGSLYKAFKDKQSLFLAAFEHYRAARARKLQGFVGETGNGLARLRGVLEFYVASSQGAAGRQGCLVVASATELSAFERDVARHITDALSRNESLLMGLIELGQADGSIAAHVDSAAAARMLLCLAQGMRVVGKTGRSRQDMQAVVDVALKALG